MNPDDRMPTIRRDVRYIYECVERARRLISPKENSEAWGELDLAIARMQGLSGFIRWEHDGPPEDPNQAAHDTVRRLTSDD